MSAEGVKLPDNMEKVLSAFLKEHKFKNYESDVSAASSMGDNYMGVLYRIKVKGTKENGNPEELHLILKVPPFSKLMRDNFPVVPLYKKEVMVYNDLFPIYCKLEKKYLIPKRMKFTPVKCYKASDANMKEFLLMEDLAEKGFQMTDRLTPMDYNHLKLAIEGLANFHAMSFLLKKLNPKRYAEFAKIASVVDFKEDQSEFLNLSRDKCIEVLQDEMHKAKVMEACKDMFGKFVYYITPRTVHPYSVLCHGDSWNNNIMYKYENGEPIEAKLLDFQILRCASPITDLANLIFTSTDETLRQKHFNALLDHYHNSLGQKLTLMEINVEECYPKAVYKDHLKKILPFGLLSAVLGLPIMAGEKGDTPDFEKMFDEDIDMKKVTMFGSEKSTNRYVQRINGVVRDMVNMKLI